ncbi:DUF6197 family protein [Microlunatus ginsengisoli]|uniref:Uncharacterized protein n=1 Tax=Microlunatus ginsengisoli TaxID=363863 RepID=A0ABP7AGQ5_9ACTN
MADSTSQRQAGPAWRVLLDRARTTLWPPHAPDHIPSPGLTPEQDRLRRLDRTRDLLEQTRAALIGGGWTGGAWFAVDAGGGRTRPVSTAEAFDLVSSGAQVGATCVVGAILRLAENPDTAASIEDAWHCVDELHEAVHERLGHGSFPPGRIYPHEQRRDHLRVVTGWNDEPGRRVEDVIDVVDRAIARTMIAACS